MDRTKLLKEQLERRILVLDGAMGTVIQSYELDESGFRGDRFSQDSRRGISERGQKDDIRADGGPHRLT